MSIVTQLDEAPGFLTIQAEVGGKKEVPFENGSQSIWELFKNYNLIYTSPDLQNCSMWAKLNFSFQLEWGNYNQGSREVHCC